jgi:hypothetical protein
MATTICPSRLLTDDGGLARDTVEWWILETQFDGMSGQAGRSRWPYPGGYLCQPARLVEAVTLLRGEWSVIMRQRSEPKPAPKSA